MSEQDIALETSPSGDEDALGASASESSSLRVLVVDDEDDVRATIRRILVVTGFDVVEANEANHALELQEARAFDAVISDISMPGMSGIELLEAMHIRDPDLPVVLLTGLPSLESAVRAVELGAYRYLLKPFDAPALVDIVRTAGRLYRMTRLRREALLHAGGATAGAADADGLALVLSHAFERLWLAHQPLLAATTRGLFGHEALMRSEDPTLSNPAAIIDAAERLGRTREMGRLVRDLASRALVSMPSEVALFVNLHPSELLDPHLMSPDSPLGAQASRVVLEITERSNLKNLHNLEKTIRGLRELGFRIALDDLGAGYASLNSFAMLQPEFVKLDMTLIRGIDQDPVRRRLVQSMVDVGHELGTMVVAEGIETDAECRVVVELGVDLLQGYLLGRPGRLRTSSAQQD